VAGGGGADVTRRHAAPIAIWAVTVAVGLVGGIAAVRQLLPDDHSEQALSVVPVPGADTTNGRVETAEVLMPAGTPAATTQPGIPDEITDWEDVRLVMPTLGEDVRVVEGVDLGALSRGVGHWPGTAEPGQTGNMVIAGHRTTHGAPFRRLDELTVGDDVGIGASGQVVTYRVTGTEIVDPGQVEVARPTTKGTATLFACHPFVSVAIRNMVRLARSA